MQVTRILAAVALLALLASTFPLVTAESPAYGCGWATETITRSGATNENAAVFAKTYTINSGVTVTTSTQTGIIICAAESITINGTLSVEGRGAAGGGVGAAGSGGWGGGGATGAVCTLGTAGGLAGLASTATLVQHRTALGGLTDGAGGLIGAGGGGGRTATALTTCAGGGGGGSFVAAAAGAAGSGTATGTAGTGTSGGTGGGWILLIAPTIIISSTGKVSCDGSDAPDVATVPSNSGGGGGGSGGWCQAKSNVFVNQGTFTSDGGDGGNGGGTGATGGVGGSATNAATPGTTPATGGAGGGGGAGGSVQIEATTTTENSRLMAWYRFEETSGTSATDATGNGRTGAMQNFAASPWVDSGLGQGLAFDGGNDYIETTEHSSFNTASFSWGLWFKADTLRLQGLMEKAPLGSMRPRIFMSGSDGVVHFDANPGDVGNLDTSATAAGVWTHIIGTYDAPRQTMSLYKNGIHQETATGITSLGNQQNYRVVVGLVDGTSPYDGVMDEVTIWNYALSHAEVSFTFNSATGLDGEDGFNSLVKTTAESAGANCANAGRKVESGLDDDRDNTLDAGEVDATTYVCNGLDGADGSDGHNALVTTTTEAPGVNCASGGQRVDSGTDDGTGAGSPDDGILHVDEITDTGYACNGATGATGATGPEGQQGPPGESGGQGNWTLRLEFEPAAAYETAPVTIYAYATRSGVPTNASLNITISGAFGTTVWSNDVLSGSMTNIATGLYQYDWTPGRLGTFNIIVNGNDTIDSFSWNEAVYVTEDGVATMGSLVELPGMTDAQVGAFLLLFAVLILCYFQRWLFVALACVIGFLDVFIVGGVFGWTFTALLLVLGIVLQILVDMRDARLERQKEAEAEGVE